MTDSLHRCIWPVSRLGEALDALARASGLAPQPLDKMPGPPASLSSDPQALDGWIMTAADMIGIEAEPMPATYPEIDLLVRQAGPALLHLKGEETVGFLLLLRSGRRTATLLAPDRRACRIHIHILSAALRRPLEQTHAGEIERVLDGISIDRRKRAGVRAALLREWLGTEMVGGCWLLRLPPGAHVWRQACQAHIPRHLFGSVAAHTISYVLWLLSWWIIGQALLQHSLQPGWLIAWALLLLTLIPLRIWAAWSQGLFSIRAGALLKQRLLAGALRLTPDEVRQQGVGQFLGRVIESDSVEGMALSGSYYGILATIELAIAAPILALGAGGIAHALALLGWIGLALALIWRFYRQWRQWTAARLDLTYDLVERMVGHRTVVAQQPSEDWHTADDRAIDRYLALARPMDTTTACLIALVPRGWLIIGLAALIPAYAAGGSPPALAIGIGGTLLAFQAMERLAMGATVSAAAIVAWQQIESLFHAAARPAHHGRPDVALAARSAHQDTAAHAGDEPPLIDARGLSFRYHERGMPALRECHLRISYGDRLLLEGPSGGGKSTLVAILSGQRHPDSGMVLLSGLDYQTLGDAGWHRRVTVAPQFHENYVFTETFAFNLLMGRRWPPTLADLVQAEALCHELGLGALLSRMPAGMQQMVGETGWQLSHGERSRLYLARALLQGADLVILDESFAALDPATLKRALHCTSRRAPTLLVIAHP